MLEAMQHNARGWTLRRRWLALAGATIVPLALCGCLAGEGGGSAPEVQPPTAAAPGDAALRAAVAGLCEAAEAAKASVPRARAIFYDRSHDQLHELARRAQDRDRAVTAGLLEAKESVERDFLYPRTWPQVGGDIDRLDQAARAALLAVAVEPPPGCTA
jgi:hypothetical protein